MDLAETLENPARVSGARRLEHQRRGLEPRPGPTPSRARARGPVHGRRSICSHGHRPVRRRRPAGGELPRVRRPGLLLLRPDALCSGQGAEPLGESLPNQEIFRRLARAMEYVEPELLRAGRVGAGAAPAAAPAPAFDFAGARRGSARSRSAASRSSSSRISPSRRRAGASRSPPTGRRPTACRGRRCRSQTHARAAGASGSSPPRRAGF